MCRDSFMSPWGGRNFFFLLFQKQRKKNLNHSVWSKMIVGFTKNYYEEENSREKK